MPSELDPRSRAERAPLLDIAGSRALPSWAYTDPDLWRAEFPAIFFRHWHYVCHDSALAEPGDYVTTAIHDQELFLTRGHDGGIRAFYNVCAHRGHVLVEGRGSKNRLVCPYHAWTYDLTGRLIGAPGSGKTEGFVRSDICLSDVRVDQMLGFVFVNLDPDAPPLAEYVGDLPEVMRAAVPGLEDMRPQQGTDYFGQDIACNWKVLVDNFLECYHCEPAHPSFSDLLDVPGTTHAFGANYTQQHVPGACKAENAAYPLDLEHDFIDGTFWLLYPNTIMGYLPGDPNFFISRVDPHAPERCRRHADQMVLLGADSQRDEQRRQWARDYVVAEDIALCEAVQRGMRSKGFAQGHYIINPDDENFTEECVRFFHRRYADEMGDALSVPAD
ncbi:MAG: aromatic ring-hydroxylating dioxygenase subunit alpha [Paracoccaceae bacterium]|nr:aromatic ring-hydroxylating dioxygenase subunit alpha [Paracoccaceae bacterium]